ncbi:unnamed protein product [Meganyctiphanes norvegica]|uniref:Uncharacterized protein n=1 Tax=Meganyctiphanes norvegica TaxID=48144 RepID=A0AAV2R0P7_MEGNR
MKARRCLLGAAALPRPPESQLRDNITPAMSGVQALGSTSCRVRRPAPFTCVWWLVMLLVLQLQCANSGVLSVGDQVSAGSSGGGDGCPVRTDAVDVQSKAYVSAQVVEATVKGEVAQVASGQPYTVSFVVSRSLRRYRGPGRVKKQATLILTFLRPHDDDESDSGAGGGAVPGADQCLVEAAIRPRRKYVLFLSGAGGGGSARSGSSDSGSGPGGSPTVVPVAAPVPASKKLRKIIKKSACSKCGE